MRTLYHYSNPVTIPEPDIWEVFPDWDRIGYYNNRLIACKYFTEDPRDCSWRVIFSWTHYLTPYHRGNYDLLFRS